MASIKSGIALSQIKNTNSRPPPVLAVDLVEKRKLSLMLPRPVHLTVVFIGLIVAACAQQRRGPPLAVEIEKYVATRASVSCDDVEAHYRIAQGVRTALDIPKYRGDLLRELPGWSAPTMALSEARLLSERSANLLRDELSRRCPAQRITGREDIVYIPS